MWRCGLREILNLGEGFNTQVVTLCKQASLLVTLWCFNMVVREILNLDLT